MQIFILGIGHVGKALAARLRADGHRVTGSTTTPEKVEALREHADEVRDFDVEAMIWQGGIKGTKRVADLLVCIDG